MPTPSDFTPNTLQSWNRIEPSFIITGNHERSDGDKTKYIIPFSKFNPQSNQENKIEYNIEHVMRLYRDKKGIKEYNFKYTFEAYSKLKKLLGNLILT